MGKLSGSMKSDLVIPFKLNKKAAVAALKKHYGGKRLLPKVFKDENHIDEVKGSMYRSVCLTSMWKRMSAMRLPDRGIIVTEKAIILRPVITRWTEEIPSRSGISLLMVLQKWLMISWNPSNHLIILRQYHFRLRIWQDIWRKNMISMRRKAGIVPMRVSKRSWRFPLPKQSKVILPWLQRNQIPACCPPEQNMPCFLCGICIPHGKETNTSLS